MPNIFAPAAKPKGFAAHGFDRDIARQNQQISPRDFIAVFLFDRPEQTPCLIQIAIVGPRVQRCKALRARAAATAPITRSISARRMPCHPDKKGPIMTIIRRPPCLRVGHQSV